MDYEYIYPADKSDVLKVEKILKEEERSENTDVESVNHLHDLVFDPEEEIGGKLSFAICKISGTPIAAASLYFTDLGCCIEKVYVCPEYRRKKIGQSLVNRLIEEAREESESILVMTTPSSVGFWMSFPGAQRNGGKVKFYI